MRPHREAAIPASLAALEEENPSRKRAAKMTHDLDGSVWERNKRGSPVHLPATVEIVARACVIVLEEDPGPFSQGKQIIPSSFRFCSYVSRTLKVPAIKVGGQHRLHRIRTTSKWP